MTTETVWEQIERASMEYKLKHYGTLDVDAFGNKLLTSDEILRIRRTKNMAPALVSTMMQKVGF